MKIIIILLLFCTLTVCFQPINKPCALKIRTYAAPTPDVWTTATDIAVLTTLTTAGTFVFIPIWYAASLMSENTCRQINRFMRPKKYKTNKPVLLKFVTSAKTDKTK